MLYIILTIAMSYQTAKLDKASFNLLTSVEPKKAIAKDPEPVIVRDTYQSYIPRRGRQSAGC